MRGRRCRVPYHRPTPARGVGSLLPKEIAHADAPLPRCAQGQADQSPEARVRRHRGGPRGGVRGPFAVLLRSPELADLVQKLGEHLRFHSTLPPRLNEFAILINARYWGSK